MAALKLPTPKRIQMIAAAVLFVLLAGCDSVEERAQRHYEKALELIERGQAGKAIIELRNAIDLNDQFAPARFEIAKLHEMERNISGAIGNYLKAIEINPHHVEARIRAANIFIMANELERAESNLDQAFKLDPDNPDLLLSRGLLQQRKGNFEAAEQDARAALRHSPAEPRAAMIIASNQQRNGDLEGALQTIERFLEVNTRDIALNVLKINVLDALGETAELTEHLRKMKRLYPDSLEIRRILSRWYLSEEMYAEAEVELRKLQELQPGNMQPVRNLVQFITETKGKDAATRELVRQVEASERFDSRFPLQVMLAELYYNDGRADEAYAMLDQIVESNAPPASMIEAQLLYGQFKAREDKLDEAKTYTQDVLATDAKNAIALGLRAAIHSEQGNDEAAVLDVRAALNESPRNPKLRRLAATIYDRNGNQELAAQALATAVVLSDYEPAYVNDYITALRTANDTRAIEAILSEAIRRHPENREFLAALAAARLRLQDWAGAERAASMLRKIDREGADKVQAVVLTGQQRYGESIELMRRLAEDNAQDGALMAALIQVYVTTGQTGEARAYLDQVLEKDPTNARAMRISGALHQLTDDQAAAEQAFRDSILADPQDAMGYLVLGRYLRAKERNEESEEIVRAGVANVPGNVMLHIQLADLLLQRGAFEEAIQEFEVVYDLQPDSLLAANNLASMLADFHGDKPELVDRAYSIAKRLASSRNPAHMDTYGWILYLRGEYGQALRSLVPAAQALPDQPWVQYHTGMAYLKLARPEEARRYLQAALDAGGQHMFPLKEQTEEALASLSTETQ